MRNYNINATEQSDQSAPRVAAAKLDPRIYLRTLIRWWWVLSIFIIIGFVGTILYLSIVDPIYQAKCRVAINRDARLDVGKTDDQWSYLQNHALLLSSQPVKKRVLEILAPEWQNRLGTLKSLEPVLSVSVVRASLGRMLDISVSSINRDYCVDFLKELIKQYKVKKDEIKGEMTVSAVTLLEQESRNLAKDIEAAEQELYEFEQRNNITYIKEKGNLETLYLTGLLHKINEIKTEQALIESQLPALEGASVPLIREATSISRESINSIPNPLFPEEMGNVSIKSSPSVTFSELGLLQSWQSLETDRYNLLKQREKLLKIRLETHPEVAALDQKITSVVEEQDMLSDIARNEMLSRLQALRLQQEALESAASSWRSAIMKSSMRNAEHNRRKLKLARLERLYDMVYSRLKEADVASNLQKEYFFLYEPIIARGDPVWPVWWKIMMPTLGFSTAFGVMLVYLIQYFDNTINTIIDVEDKTSLICLGGIPQWKIEPTGSSKLLLNKQKEAPIESFRGLRTAVVTHLEDLSSKILMVTSPEVKDGKTTVAANIALVLAQIPKKVLLIDGDLRKSDLTQIAGIKNDSPGFSDVIVGKIPIEEGKYSSSILGIDVMPVGTVIDQPPELFHQSDLSSVFDKLRERYDYVIVDSAPINRVTDSVILGMKVDAVLMIIGAGITTLPVISYALHQMNRSRIIGAVLNGIRLSDLTYNYPYYYGYSYGYGSKKSEKGFRQWFSKKFSSSQDAESETSNDQNNFK